MTAPRIEVHADAAALATAVAGALLSRLADAQAAGHEPQIALTGGSIADAVHHELARLSPGSEVDWSPGRRLVGRRAVRRPRLRRPQRAAQARAAFLDPVGADPQVHEMPLDRRCATDVDAAAAAYCREMREARQPASSTW